jgi:hypothetical protein
MSSAAEADQNVCANCGIEEGDDIKLKDCGDCDLVKFCSDGCRELHRPKHADECRKREKQLHDRKLFTQPDRTDECPICFLPLPIDIGKSTFKACCSAVICKGCVYANCKSGGGNNCPFCREPLPKKGEVKKRVMKRVKANDPVALRYVGEKCYKEGDYEGAFKYGTKAAEVGDMAAHAQLGFMYYEGRGVEKDMEKAICHYEKAAIGGHPEARLALAVIEEENGSMDRAVKHFIIAAKLGYDLSMKALWGHYSAGNITKEELDITLRSHQAAIDEMKSEQRDKADQFFKD